MKTCIQLKNLAFPVRLEQYGAGKWFRVVYGKQVKRNLTYSEAALIAAAPVLLDAVKEAADWIARTGRGPQKLFDKLKAAEYQATGQEGG